MTFKDTAQVVISAVVLIFFFLVGSNAQAQALGAPLSMANKIQEMPLVLLGKAVKKFLTFRVVSVDLSIAQGYGAAQIFEDIPRRLQVVYHVNIPKSELDRATLKGIEKNVSEEELKVLLPRINQINSYYPDVQSGDQIVITYIPGIGSEVKVNGEVKGLIPGKDFADAFFAIWVGENPVDPRARLQLLGKKSKEN